MYPEVPGIPVGLPAGRQAMVVLEEDFEACIAPLQFLKRHHKYIRTINLLERLFEGERRRMKINPNMFGEKAVMKLMYSTMIRAQAGWRPDSGKSL